MNCLHNLSGSFPQGSTDFFRSQCGNFGKSCDNVSAFYFHSPKSCLFAGRPDFDFNVLRSILSDKKAVLLSYIIHNCVVKIISRNLHRCRNYHASYRYNRNIRSSRTNIHNQISKRFGDIHTCSNCGSNRFFHKKNLPGSGLICSFFHSLTLNFRNAAWHADADPRFPKSSPSHGLRNKIFQHLFHYIIIYNHASADRPYDFHVG